MELQIIQQESITSMSSGIRNVYIGSTKDELLTGCFKVSDGKIYMNFFSRSNPKHGVSNLFTIDSFEKDKIVVKIAGKTITWKRYE